MAIVKEFNSNRYQQPKIEIRGLHRGTYVKSPATGEYYIITENGTVRLKDGLFVDFAVWRNMIPEVIEAGKELIITI